jgi:hypothetical protein
MTMNKGMIRVISLAGILLMANSAAWAADVWKIVDEDGNVSYTDQRPEDGSAPMKLPELSVIETDYQPEKPPGAGAAGEVESKEPTSGELRRLYRDFRITRPLPEESFWGTANAVMVTWGSKTAITPGMNVRLIVDGKAQSAPASGSIALTLDRGEHKVSAELRDSGNRRIVAAEPVTFFVKQNSANFNRPRPVPRRGN